MKINMKKSLLTISLTLLCNPTITANDCIENSHDEMPSESLRAVPSDLSELLARLSSNSISQIKGADQTRTLTTITERIAVAQDTLAADIAAVQTALAEDVANLGTTSDSSGLYPALLSIVVLNGMVTPSALISGNSQAELQTAQLTLLEFTERNAALTTPVTTSSGGPAPTAVATYNTAIVNLLANVAAAITAVQLNVKTPNPTNLTAAINAVDLAISSLNTAIIDFNIVVNYNPTITSTFSLVQINTELVALTSQLVYLQTLGLQAP